MNTKKQTAVEWLLEEVHKNVAWIPLQIQQQALAMEREQIEQAYIGDSDLAADFDYIIELAAKKYYTETYGK
jgi:hypothetical protein